jgi:predicted Fe-Mo cluster-binding NifX family protein
MVKTVLIPADSLDTNAAAGQHFGRTRWYRIFDSEGNNIENITGTETTRCGGIFKKLSDNLPEAIIVNHMGFPAYQSARYRDIAVMHMAPFRTAAEAAAGYFDGKLKPLGKVQIHGYPEFEN